MTTPDPTSDTDAEWFAATGMCGGCGTKECLCGGCTEDICSRCPARIAEGWPGVAR